MRMLADGGAVEQELSSLPVAQHPAAQSALLDELESAVAQLPACVPRPDADPRERPPGLP